MAQKAGREAWNGKFKLTNQQNVEEFMAKLGAAPEQVEAVKALEITNELSNNGDDYCMVQRSGGVENVIKVTLGVRCEEIKTLDGMVLKGTVTIDDNNDVRGDYGDFQEHMTITPEGVITDTLTFGGVSLIRTYQKI